MFVASPGVKEGPGGPCDRQVHGQDRKCQSLEKFFQALKKVGVSLKFSPSFLLLLEASHVHISSSSYTSQDSYQAEILGETQ